MAFAQLVPVILSLLVLGAHFFRNGEMFLVLGTLGVIGCLSARRPWVPRVAQMVLLLGCIEQVRTLVVLASERRSHGEPFLRLAIILGAVALVTGLSALLFETACLRRRYRRAPGAGGAPP